MKRKKETDSFRKEKIAFIVTFCIILTLSGMVLAYKNTRSLGFGDNSDILVIQSTDEKIEISGAGSYTIDKGTVDKAADEIQKGGVLIPREVRLTWQASAVFPDLADRIGIAVNQFLESYRNRPL